MLTLLRFFFVFPLILFRVLWRRLRRLSPPRWTFAFHLGNDVLRWLFGRMLAGFIAGKRSHLPAPRLPRALARRVDCTPTTLGGVKAEWVAPKGTSPTRCLLYLHGGGWVTGSIETHRALLARFALASQCRVVGIDYRLAPEHPFPAGLTDCLAAYKALLAAGESPAQLLIGGDSAGGNLSLATLLSLKAEGLPLPAGAVLISPAVDLRFLASATPENVPWDFLGALIEQADGLLGAYVTGDGRSDPLVSPLCGDLRGLPPMLVQVGGREVLRDQVVAFDAKARDAGVRVELRVAEDMVHVWHAFSGLQPEADAAIAQVGEFVQRLTPG